MRRRRWARIPRARRRRTGGRLKFRYGIIQLQLNGVSLVKQALGPEDPEASAQVRGGEGAATPLQSPGKKGLFFFWGGGDKFYILVFFSLVLQKTPTQRRRKSLDDKEEQSLALKGSGGCGATSDAGDSSKKTKKRTGEPSKELL